MSPPVTRACPAGPTCNQRRRPGTFYLSHPPGCHNHTLRNPHDVHNCQNTLRCSLASPVVELDPTFNAQHKGQLGPDIKHLQCKCRVHYLPSVHIESTGECRVSCPVSCLAPVIPPTARHYLWDRLGTSQRRIINTICTLVKLQDLTGFEMKTISIVIMPHRSQAWARST